VTKKVVGVFVRFRAPLSQTFSHNAWCKRQKETAEFIIDRAFSVPRYSPATTVSHARRTLRFSSANSAASF
jgi:hypothetical protein